MVAVFMRLKQEKGQGIFTCTIVPFGIVPMERCFLLKVWAILSSVIAFLPVPTVADIMEIQQILNCIFITVLLEKKKRILSFSGRIFMPLIVLGLKLQNILSMNMYPYLSRRIWKNSPVMNMHLPMYPG